MPKMFFNKSLKNFRLSSIEQKKNLILVIPSLIVLAFVVKAASLYIAKVIMIGVAVDVTKDIQFDVFSSILNADTKLIENKQNYFKYLSKKITVNLTKWNLA